jgi:hypothetical protein
MTDITDDGLGTPFGLGGDLPVQRLGFGTMAAANGAPMAGPSTSARHARRACNA